MTKKDFSKAQEILDKENEFKKEKESKEFSIKTPLYFLLALFLVALLPRLYVLFFVTQPQNAGVGWYNDTYHHWQIGYLTYSVGLKHGFLRLWDFKGMEFFWGLLHPLTLVLLFKLTGTVDILVSRLLSSVFGAINIVLLFQILRKYFNLNTALAASLIAIFTPVVLFTNTVGMQEEIGIFLLFSGFLVWPRRPALFGILLALAGMVRAEYWVFGLVLVAITTVKERHLDRDIPLLFGYGVPTLLYMKYLLDWTGNPIYPIWWNFMGNMAGEWANMAVSLNSFQVQTKLIFQILFVLGLIIALIVFIRKPKYYLFSLLGLGNIMLIALMFGFSAYIWGYIPRYWVDRLMLLPHIYIGAFFSAFLLYFLPKKWPKIVYISWPLVILILLVSFSLWKPILRYYNPSREIWKNEQELASAVASYYKSGSVLIPEDKPVLTYSLVRYHNIKGPNLVGQMFDPFYYMKGDPFADWEENKKIIFDWIKEYDIKLMAFYPDRERYNKLIEKEPNSFNLLSEGGSIKVYEVVLQ